jgi:hypothetical protein
MINSFGEKKEIEILEMTSLTNHIKNSMENMSIRQKKEYQGLKTRMWTYYIQIAQQREKNYN